MNRLLWTLQILLALLFLFAGVVKFTIPIDQITKTTHLPGWFIHFIGVAEIMGAAGLILPWLLRIKAALTPLAALGLLIIMIGATVVTAETSQLAGATLPFVTGILCAVVAWGRRPVA